MFATLFKRLPGVVFATGSRRCYAAGSFDVIVAGLGSHGSACAYHLAKSGAKVLGLEQHGVSHTRGSHHGQTRITRQAYLEGAAYVPLLRRAFDLYAALEQETQQQLFHRVGCLNMGEPVCSAAHASALAHDLPHELLTGADVNERHPGFQLPPDLPVLFEAAGGFLEPEKMIQAHCAVAERHGAELHTDERVLSWQASSGGVTVVTEKGRYAAGRLVLTAGAWMHKLVPELQGLSRPCRVSVAWFESARPQLYQPSNCPVFIMQDAVTRTAYYGFPEFGSPGVKAGVFAAGAEVDPDALDRRQWGPEDEAPLRTFMEAYLPHASGRVLRSSVCMFVMTPDSHFVIDHHPLHPQVVLCSACSGHGFKLSPVVGSVLSDLALQGRCADFEAQLQQHKLTATRPGHEAVLGRFGAA